MTKSYEEIWDGYPNTWLVPTEVSIRHSNGARETVTVMMASHNEWLERVQRVVSLRYGYSEDSFEVIKWKPEDGEWTSE